MVAEITPTTAATPITPRILDREKWNARALQLAETAGLTATSARVLASDSYGVAYGMRRRRPIGREYIVLITRRDLYARCDCIAGLRGWPCSHAGAAILAEQERARREERVAAADADRWALIEAGQW